MLSGMPLTHFWKPNLHSSMMKERQTLKAYPCLGDHLLYFKEKKVDTYLNLCFSFLGKRPSFLILR